MGLLENIREKMIMGFLRGLLRRFSFENLTLPSTWAGIFTILAALLGSEYVPPELQDAFVKAGIAIGALLVAFMRSRNARG